VKEEGPAADVEHQEGGCEVQQDYSKAASDAKYPAIAKCTRMVTTLSDHLHVYTGGYK